MLSDHEFNVLRIYCLFEDLFFATRLGANFHLSVIFIQIPHAAKIAHVWPLYHNKCAGYCQKNDRFCIAIRNFVYIRLTVLFIFVMHRKTWLRSRDGFMEFIGKSLERGYTEGSFRSWKLVQRCSGEKKQLAQGTADRPEGIGYLVGRARCEISRCRASEKLSKVRNVVGRSDIDDRRIIHMFVFLFIRHMGLLRYYSIDVATFYLLVTAIIFFFFGKWPIRVTMRKKKIDWAIISVIIEVGIHSKWHSSTIRPSSLTQIVPIAHRRWRIFYNIFILWIIRYRFTLSRALSVIMYR